MIFISNPLVLPLTILIWSGDAWLWLAAMKFIAEKIKPANRFSQAIDPVIDWVPQYLNRCLLRLVNKTLSPRTLWIVSVTSLFFMRCLFISLIVTVQ